MENINLDIQVRRISNGFIIKKNGSKSEFFTASIRDYISNQILENLSDVDEYFKTHDADGDEFTIKATSDLFNEPLDGC